MAADASGPKRKEAHTRVEQTRVELEELLSLKFTRWNNPGRYFAELVHSDIVGGQPRTLMRVKFSASGELVLISADTAWMLPGGQGTFRKIEDLFERNGYVVVPREQLDYPYTGTAQNYHGVPFADIGWDWYHRFFGD